MAHLTFQLPRSNGFADIEVLTEDSFVSNTMYSGCNWPDLFAIAPKCIDGKLLGLKQDCDNFRVPLRKAFDHSFFTSPRSKGGTQLTDRDAPVRR